MNNENLNVNEKKSKLEELIDKINVELEKIKSLPELKDEKNADDIYNILNYIHQHPKNLNTIKEMINDTKNNN